MTREPLSEQGSESSVFASVEDAVAAGARGLEAAVVVAGHAPELSAVAELAGPGVPVRHCDARGQVLEELTT